MSKTVFDREELEKLYESIRQHTKRRPDFNSPNISQSDRLKRETLNRFDAIVKEVVRKENEVISEMLRRIFGRTPNEQELGMCQMKTISQELNRTERCLIVRGKPRWGLITHWVDARYVIEAFEIES